MRVLLSVLALALVAACEPVAMPEQGAIIDAPAPGVSATASEAQAMSPTVTAGGAAVSTTAPEATS